jgi:hypothetical protein
MLQILYTSSSIVRIIRSRTVRSAHKILIGNPEERELLEDVNIDGRPISLILGKQGEGVWVNTDCGLL